MRQVLHIGHTDLRIFLKSRSAYIWLFIVPLAFVYFMGFANPGPGSPSNHKAPVLIENQDTGFLSRILLEEMKAQDMWLVNPTNRDSAARVIRIPTNFTRGILDGRQVKIGFLEKNESPQADTALTELHLLRAVVAMNGHLLEAGTPSNGVTNLSEKRFREVLAVTNPVRLDARFAGRRPVPSGFNFSLPANLVMYLMMNLLIFGGASLASERRDGVIKRLMVHPVTTGQIVAGKIYGLLLLGTVQILVFLAIGRFVFHVNLGANLPGVAITLLILAWVASSLGVLAGSLLTMEDRVAGVCVLAALLMGALGGCWWPVEIGPPALRAIALCLPTGWAVLALNQLISFGSGIGAVWLPLVVLAGFGAAANLLAAHFFRR